MSEQLMRYQNKRATLTICNKFVCNYRTSFIWPKILKFDEEFECRLFDAANVNKVCAAFCLIYGMTCRHGIRRFEDGKTEMCKSI